MDFLDEVIVRVSREVENRLDPFGGEVEVEQRMAETLGAEIGVDVNHFPRPSPYGTVGRTLSWKQRECRKAKSGNTRRGNIWLILILLEVAWAPSRAKGTFLSIPSDRLARPC